MADLGTIGYEAKRTYKAARQSGFLEGLTRIGFAAKGVVYFIIGILALMAAFNEGGETTDKKGVITRIAAQPFGEFALAVIAVGLLAYAFWRFTAAIKNTEGAEHNAKGTGKRIAYFVNGILYSAVAFSALKLLAGKGSGGGDQTQSVTARLLNAPFGTLLLAAIGAAVVAYGFMQIRKGVKEKFAKHLRMDEMTPGEQHWAYRLGRWGHVARGIVFGIIGVFVIFAATRHDPGQVRGIEGALDAIAVQPFGQIMLGLVAAGLACYGMYCVVEARFRRVHV